MKPFVLDHQNASEYLNDPRHAVIFDGTSFRVEPAETLLDILEDEDEKTIEVVEFYNDIDDAFDNVEFMNEELG